MNPTTQQSSSLDRVNFATATLVMLLLWLCLWFGGWPKPNVDDAFFVGTAVSLASEGRLSNPWVSGWLAYINGADPSKFLVQPPLYPLVLAGWLKTFGVSTVSLTGYGCLVGWLACCFLWRLLRVLQVGVLAAYLGALVIGAWLLTRGLRPEPFAFLCATAGQICFLRYRSVRGWLAGGMLGGLAVSAHPFWVILVVPATLLQCLSALQASISLRPLLIAMATGIIAALLPIVATIGTDLAAFWHDFRTHARFVAPAGDRLERFGHHLWIGYERYVNTLLAALSLAAIYVARENRRRQLRLVVALATVVTTGLALYAAQTAMFTVLLLALLPLLLVEGHTGWRRILQLSPAVLMFSWLLLSHLMQSLADFRMDARNRRSEVLNYVARANPEIILFDSTTLRYMFDYRPPAGAVDLAWAWGPGHADRWWTPTALHPRDLWIVNPAWSHKRLPGEAHHGQLVLNRRRFASVRSTRALLIIPGSELPDPASLPAKRFNPP